jgi:hypothetical protein
MKSYSAMISFYERGAGERDPYATEYLPLEEYGSPEEMVDEATEMADKAVRRGAYSYADVDIEIIEVDENGKRIDSEDPDYSGIVAYCGDWSDAGFHKEPEVVDLIEVFGES